MSLIKCPKCGEMFSDSYKTCPFCEEDEAYYGGRVKKSRGRRTQEDRKRRAPSILGPVVVVVLVLLAALVVWLIFGDQIKELITGEKPPIEDVQPGPDNSTIDKPDDPVVTPTISLNRAILALTVGDKETLKVSGTEDDVSWESSDPAVVSVTSGGEVTALAKGTAVITARVGDEAVTCTVTVADEDSTTTPDPDPEPEPEPDPKPDPKPNTTKVDVSKWVITATSEFGYTGELAATGETGMFEMSANKGEVWTLAIKGASGTVKWAVESNSSDLISLEGDKLTITGSSGSATITGTVNGGTVKAVIRPR